MMKILSMLLLLGLAGSVYSNWQLMQKNTQAQGKIAEDEAKLAKLQARLDKVSTRFAADADAEREAIARLKEQLKTEQDSLATLEFDRNRARNGGVGGDDPSNYDEPIKTSQASVQDLESQLRQLNGQGSAFSQRQKQALGETKYEESVAAEQLSAAIRSGQQNLENMQLQRKELEPHIFDAGVNDQIKSLTSQINDQKNQLASLKAQRQAYLNQGRSAENSINGQTGAQFNQLRQDRAQIESRLRAEKANLADLQKRQKQAMQSRSSQKASINQAEQAYQAQKQKVEAIQAQLKTEQARLDGLTFD